MDKRFGDAVWIGSSHPFDLHEVYLNFFSPLLTGDSAESAELLISADSRYRLWVNGTFVCRGPSRSYPHRQSFDRVNLSDYWQTGKNSLAVQVYQPGYSHFSYVHRAAAGLLAALWVDGEIRLVSDSNWRVQRDPSFSAEVPRISIYGSGIEVQDLTLSTNWQSSPDLENWDSARTVAGSTGPIWHGLQERITPMPIEQTVSADLLEARRTAITVDQSTHPDQVHDQLRHAWHSASIACVNQADSWFQVPQSETESTLWLFDLGHAYTCQGWAEVRGAAGDEHLLISYADKFKDGELVISDPATYCRVRPTDHFRLRAGEQTAESFSMRGGRYIIFMLSGIRSDNFEIRFHFRTAEYPLKISKPLIFENQKLNQIIEMCESTFKACLQDSFVDCVWRESSQWLGDGLIQSKILASVTDDLSLIQKLLLDPAAGQDQAGLVPSIAPGEVHAYNIPRYACMWVECLAFYLRETGDSEFLTRNNNLVWSTLIRLLEYLTDHAPKDENGLYINPAGRRHYIDWSATSQNDPHCVINLHIIIALQEAIAIADIIDPSLQNGWRAEIFDLISLCQTHFWDDGIWYDDLEQTTHSQLGSAMALRVGCIPESEHNEQLDLIIGRSMDLNDEHLENEMALASPFMHHYLFETLAMFGREQAILDIILARWGRWTEQGEVTTWENWNIDFPDGSACHAFSAHPRYHLAQLVKQGALSIPSHNQS